MLDRLFVEEQIIRLTNDILRKEKFLKYAKDYDVVVSIRNDIARLRFERDLYLYFIWNERCIMRKIFREILDLIVIALCIGLTYVCAFGLLYLALLCLTMSV